MKVFLTGYSQWKAPIVMTTRDYFTLDPSITFLNHGSFGATPIPVQQTQQAWRERMERQPVRFLGREILDLLREARDLLAAYLGAQGEDIVFVTNATTGVNVVAQSLEKTLNRGDEILSNDHEYGACANAWIAVCNRRDARFVTQPLPMPDEIEGGEEEYVERLWQGVTERTRLILISHISSPTALKLPVEQVIARAHAQGILVLVDGAHAPGQIPLNLDELGADFYTGNCHKWLCAPKGSAFLHVRAEHQHLIEPLVVSWGSEPHRHWNTGSAFQDALISLGTADYTPYLSVPAAIEFQAKHQWHEKRAAASALLNEWLPIFAERMGFAPVYGGAGAALRPPQLAVSPLPVSSVLASLKSRLYDVWNIEIPLTTHGRRQFMRISIQGYNSADDLARLLEALVAETKAV